MVHGSTASSLSVTVLSLLTLPVKLWLLLLNYVTVTKSWPKRHSYEARQSFQQGKQDEGYAKYQEIIEKYYASPLYRNVKRSLEERK